MSNSKVVAKIIFIVTILTITGVVFYLPQRYSKEKPTAIVLVSDGKQNMQGLQKEMGYAFKQFGFIQKGETLLNEGHAEEAIGAFKEALAQAQSAGARGEAHFYLADAYEKIQNYKSALDEMVIVRDKYVNDWAKEPILERISYLEFILKGDYDSALEHAEKALEADKKLPNTPKTGSPDYVERIKNLKTAKNYIESLKSKENEL